MTKSTILHTEINKSETNYHTRGYTPGEKYKNPLPPPPPPTTGSDVSKPKNSSDNSKADKF
jgi:hypothetical protein